MEPQNKTSGTEKNDKTVRQRKRSFASSPQRFLPIGEIKEDTVILKNGGVRAVMQVNAINFNLKSEAEQEGILIGYQSFLNTLTFPVQIFIRSARLNIDPYIHSLRDMGAKQENGLLKQQTVSYANFIEKLINVADIMQKKFYIVVPVDGSSSKKKGLLTSFFSWMSNDDSRAKALQRRREFAALNKILRDRVLLVQSGLENIGITMKRLSTQELMQLYYGIYNPDTSQKEKLTDLESLKLDKGTL